MKQTIRLNETQLQRIVAECVKNVLMENKSVNEISSRLLSRAAEKAHNDMMQNWHDGKIRMKRERQSKKFRDAAGAMEYKEKDSVCPYVPESELRNMPEGTYVVLDGAGRDFYWNIIYRYSGHAGTKKQCLAYADKYYDKSANWEFLPKVVSVEEYFKNFARN